MNEFTDGTKFELNDLTAGDIFDAVDEAKTVQFMRLTKGDVTEEHPVFVTDNIKLQRLLLLKNVKSFGDGSKEPDMNWLRSLSEADYQILDAAVETMDQATLKELSNRGRDSAVS